MGIEKTYPDSLPYSVLDTIGRSISVSIRATHASAAAEAIRKVEDLGYAMLRLPAGMSVEGAEKALAEHVAWAPWDGIASLVGRRVRVIRRDGSTCIEGTVGSQSGDSIRMGPQSGGGLSFVLLAGDSPQVNPDDVPTDPDAELIEAMAVELHHLKHAGDRVWDVRPEGAKQIWRDEARRFLAVVREHEAGQR